MKYTEKMGCPKFVSEVIWEGKALIYKHCWSKDHDNFWIQIVSVVVWSDEREEHQVTEL